MSGLLYHANPGAPHFKDFGLLGRMANLTYYTTEVVEDLRTRIAEHLDWYYAPQGRPPSAASVGGLRESTLTAPALAERLVTEAGRPSSTDVENALIVYEALSRIHRRTPMDGVRTAEEG